MQCLAGIPLILAAALAGAASLLAAPTAWAACNGRDLIASMPPAERRALEDKANAAPFAKGNLWLATKDNLRVTLVGTYHLDDPRFGAMMASLAPAIQAAHTLLVEAGPDDIADLKAEILADPALIVAPYDAELFGHWWFEGPDWLNFLLRKMSFDQPTIKTITVPEYLEAHPRIQQCQPVMSSWGFKGYNEVWLEQSNEWIYPHLHIDAERMVEMVGNILEPTELQERALNQAARELLLAQSSDWAFIMKTGTMMEYAIQRTQVHVLNFNHLYDQITTDAIDEDWLAEIERRHNIFPDIDHRIYR